MKAHITVDERHATKMEKEPRIRGIRYYLQRVRDAISKYVTVEKDAIYKDPDWPHLWDHKR